MGNCGSTEEGQLGYSAVGSHPNSPQDEEVSKSIDKQIRLDEKRLSREHKLLLLGAGESGKTTILKVSGLALQTVSLSAIVTKLAYMDLVCSK